MTMQTTSPPNVSHPVKPSGRPRPAIVHMHRERFIVPNPPVRCLEHGNLNAEKTIPGPTQSKDTNDKPSVEEPLVARGAEFQVSSIECHEVSPHNNIERCDEDRGKYKQ